jgi:hypothetical protein
MDNKDETPDNRTFSKITNDKASRAKKQTPQEKILLGKIHRSVFRRLDFLEKDVALLKVLRQQHQRITMIILSSEFPS